MWKADLGVLDWRMTLPAKRAASYADLAALSKHVVGEILRGELVVSPRPAPRHAEAASSLTGVLVPPFRFGEGGPGGWWILAEPEVHLGDDVLVPDLAGWRHQRMPALPEEAFFTLPPDWVCEVLSPSTSRVDRTQKLPIYQREAIPHVWLIDPSAQTLEVYRLDSKSWLLEATHGGDEAVRAAPFEAITMNLSRLWGRSEP
jgi:Uma2 family endonuclease